jgi:hypothetical protein
MSFSWLGTFRIGQWKEFRHFTLNERRDVDSSIEVIDSELERIGDIIIRYEAEEVSDEKPDGTKASTFNVTERRLGVYVPKNTSLDKLMKAYIALGGNPLDISMFLKPNPPYFQNDDGTGQDPNEESRSMTGLDKVYPHDGIVAPETPAAFNPSGGVYEGGFLTWGKYPWRRFSGQMDDSNLNAGIASRVDHARRWCNQALFEKRNNIEARIIKLMDLREQLEKEKDEILAQAVGGTVGSLDIPDPELFHPDYHLTAVVSDIDRVLYEESERGGVDPTKPSDTRFDYLTILEDEPGDENTAL